MTQRDGVKGQTYEKLGNEGGFLGLPTAGGPRKTEKKVWQDATITHGVIGPD